MKNATVFFCLLTLCALSHAVCAEDAPASTNAGTKQDLCVKPARGPIQVAATSPVSTAMAAPQQPMAIARVGKPAPDFEANALVDGGFRPIRLSDFRGKWVVLCFYPGDFTFV